MGIRACRNRRDAIAYRILVIMILSGSGLEGYTQFPNGPLNLPHGLITIGALTDSVHRQYPSVRCAWTEIDTSRKFLPPQKGSVEQMLRTILDNFGLYPTVYNKGALIYFKRKEHPITPLHTKGKPVQGTEFTITVRGPDGGTLPNVSLRLKRSGQKLTTNKDGMVTARWEKGMELETVRCSVAGMQTEIKTITAPDPLTIYLTESFSTLLDFVIYGYVMDSRLLVPADRTVMTGHQLHYSPGTTISSILSGQVPGLLSTMTSGVHGAAYNTTIRGRSSIMNGSSPLYIIDNVPFAPGDHSISNITSGSSAGSLSPFSFISLGNIEKVEVLKDADATAIYGTRGANGVILITTKHGLAGTPTLTIEASTGISQTTTRPHLMDIHQYSQLRREALKNDGLTINNFNAPELTQWDTTISRDWGKWLIGGPAYTHGLEASLSGGNNHTRYYAGLSGLRETNVFPNRPAHNLLNIATTINHFSADNRWNIQTSALLGWDWNHQFIIDPAQLQFLVPNTPPLQNKAGNISFSSNQVSFYNPLSLLNNPYKATSHNYLFNAITNYRPVLSVPAFTIKLNLGVNEVQNRELSLIPIRSQDPSYAPTGTSYFATTTYRSAIAEQLLQYKKDTGKFTFNILGGASWQMQWSSMSDISAIGFTSDINLLQTSLAPSSVSDSSDKHYHYMGLLSRLNVNWNKKYSLSLSGRREGSTQFSTNPRFGNFMAISPAWIFSNEPFFKKISKVVSFGKLRGSYGITGNDLIGAHTYPEGLHGLLQKVPAYNFPAIIPSGPTWETTRKTDISIDAALWKDRLSFSASWYRNVSDNQLLPDSTTGPNHIYHSWPIRLANKGWEFSLTSNNINRKDLQWFTTVNLSLPVNRLVSGPLPYSYARNLVPGQSVNVLRGYRYAGVDSKTGLFSFRDLNGDGKLTEADMTVIGKLDVTCFGGLSNTFRWHQWQLECLAEGRIQKGINAQGVLYAYTPPGSISSGLSFSNTTTELNNRWRQPGDQAQYQKLTTSSNSEAGKAINNYVSSSAMLVNTSFVRLRKLNLSYQLPAPLLMRMKMSAGSLYIEGQNLFTLTPYKIADPELQSVLVMPPLRSVEAGIRVKF